MMRLGSFAIALALFGTNSSYTMKTIEFNQNSECICGNQAHGLCDAIIKKCFFCCKKYKNQVNNKDENGSVPLHEAASRGYDEFLLFLLENGATASINEKDNNYGLTPLLAAALTGEPQSIKMLLEWGADMTTIDKKDERALHYAASYPFPEAVNILLSWPFQLAHQALNNKSIPHKLTQNTLAQKIWNSKDPLKEAEQFIIKWVAQKDNSNRTALEKAIRGYEMDQKIGEFKKYKNLENRYKQIFEALKKYTK